MSHWRKSLLGIGAVALGVLVLLLVKSRSSAVQTPVGPTAVETPAKTVRSELRHPGDPSTEPVAGVLIGPIPPTRSPVVANFDTTSAAKTMWRISGVAVTPDREPVPHAQIWLGWSELLGSADAKGKFDLSGATFPFPSDKLAFLNGSNNGIQSPFAARVALQPGDSVEGLALVIAELRDVVVHVVDAQQQPVANSQVQVQILDAGVSGNRRQGMTTLKFPASTLATDASGGAVLKNLPRIACFLFVRLEGYEPGSHTLQATADELVLSLRRQSAPFVFSGIVHDEFGRPVPSAHLTCHFGEDMKRARSASDGRFQWELNRRGDPARKVVSASWLAVTAEGYQPAYFDLSHLAHEDLVPMEITLAPGLVIAGVVLDPNNQPVGGASVALTGELSPASQREFGKKLKRKVVATDEQGRFRIGSLWPGVFRVRVRSGKFDLPENVEVASGTEDLVVRLVSEVEGTALIRLHVRDAVTKKLLGPYKLKIRGDDGSRAPQLSTGEGWVRISPGKAASFTITLNAGGYLPCHFSARTFAAGEHDLDFHFERSANFRLRVVDKRGFPMQGVFVTVAGQPRADDFNGTSVSQGKPLTTGYDGRLFFKEVRAGEVRVFLRNNADGAWRNVLAETSDDDSAEHVIEW